MQRISAFLCGVVVGALLCYWTTHYHLVRAQDGFYVVPKTRAGVLDAYVDVRSFGVTDWAEHADLAAALVADNQQQVIQDSAVNALQDTANQLVPGWPQQ